MTTPQEEIFEKYAWNHNPPEFRAFADNLLKYVGQDTISDQHNNDLKKAIDESLSAGQKAERERCIQTLSEKAFTESILDAIAQKAVSGFYDYKPIRIDLHGEYHDFKNWKEYGLNNKDAIERAVQAVISKAISALKPDAKT